MFVSVRLQHLTRFIEFVFLGLPRRLFTIGRRVLALTNYELSFTLNLRLIFVPLYGDYTRAGRVIGLVFRLLSIIFGFVVLVVFSVTVILLPLFWYFMLFGVFYYHSLWALVGLVGFFAVWWVYTRNKPAKKGDPRPYVAELVRNIKIRGNLEVKDFIYSASLNDLFFRLELSNTDFKLEMSKTYLYEEVIKFVNDWVSKSNNYVESFGNLFVEPEELFLGILSTFPHLEKFLYKYNLVFNDFEECAKWLIEKRDEGEKMYVWQDFYKIPVMGGIGKGLTGRVTPGLDTVSTDFTQLVKRGLVEKIYWRAEEIKRVADLLGGSSRNVLVIGPPGCGKTGIVKGIAYQIITGTEYEQLRFKRIVCLEVGKILAGTKGSGGVADNLKLALEDAIGSGDVILFIDDIHTLIASSQEEDSRTSSAYTVLTNYLEEGRLQFIGATNIENYRKYIEPNGSFARLFQVIEIPPSSKEETLKIIKVKSQILEKQFKIKITFIALKKIIEMSHKMIHERVFPDKAIEMLNRCAAKISRSTKEVNSNLVLEVLSEVTHIPVTAVTQEESQKLLNIETEMKKRVIGQDESINMIGSALKRSRAGIRNTNKPMASFLFVGTTGVGKTETAKALAQSYFGDEKLMIRLDMSEYQQQDSLSRLLGSPDGSSKGILTEAVRNRPFALILLDEIEKAHQNILLTFLQVLDDGRLTDPSGVTVDFTNTIIIATSNVGTRSIQAVFGRNGSFEEMKEIAMKDVREKFAPEFLNRFNSIIVYKPLSTDSVRKITNLMLNGVRKNAEEKSIKIDFKAELVDELLKRGYSLEWGARPMARVIEETVMNYLAIKILSREIGSGDSVELGMEVFS